MNKLLNDLIPSILVSRKTPRNKNYIIFLLNNGNWTSIPNDGIIIKLVEFYQKLKWFNMNKACVPKVTWNVVDKPNLCNYNVKDLFREINNTNNYIGHVINVCFGFHQAIKKYYYDRFNRNIINPCLIDVYRPLATKRSFVDILYNYFRKQGRIPALFAKKETLQLDTGNNWNKYLGEIIHYETNSKNFKSLPCYVQKAVKMANDLEYRGDVEGVGENLLHILCSITFEARNSIFEDEKYGNYVPVNSYDGLLAFSDTKPINIGNYCTDCIIISDIYTSYSVYLAGYKYKCTKVTCNGDKVGQITFTDLGQLPTPCTRCIS